MSVLVNGLTSGALRGLAAWTLPAAAGRSSLLNPDRVELTPSVWPSISRPELARFHANLQNDLVACEEFLSKNTSGVFVLGSARTKEGTEDFRLGEQVGEVMAEFGAEPWTGGGPGIMWAVPRAFRKLAERWGNKMKTLGVGLELPHEQKINPDIDESATLHEFLFRKVALYRNGRGFLALPGGIGTLDEVFEIWAQTTRDQHKGHLGVMGTEFWKPLVNTLYNVAVRDRKLISPQAWRRLSYTDDARAFMSRLPSKEAVRNGQEPFETVAARMGREITQTVQALDDRPEAIAMLGGRELKPDDPALRCLQELSRLLTREGETLRVGSPNNIAQAVVSGARRADSQATVQALQLEGEALRKKPGLEVLATQTDFIVHKELLTRSARGLVFAPGGLGTLSTFFAALTQIQTKKRDKVPMVLIGRSFWEPIIRSMHQMMLDGDRQYIKQEDLKLFTVTDDPQVARDALLGKETAQADLPWLLAS